MLTIFSVIPGIFDTQVFGKWPKLLDVEAFLEDTIKVVYLILSSCIESVIYMTGDNKNQLIQSVQL